MYIPAAFREDDTEKLFDLIERHSFGLLISDIDGVPFATHLPLLLDRSVAPQGCLIGHMARANSHWEKADGNTVLAVFAGPHAYISPTWYEAENVVPTWNYVAVHASGTFRAIREQQALLEIVGRYVDFYEAAFPRPWKLDAASDYAKKMAGAIVGFQIEISRLEGKWKLNQNHPRERREKVVRALRGSDSEDARAVAELMQEQLAEESGHAP